VPSRIVGHRSDGGSVGLSHPQAARTDNPTEPFQPLAPSKQSAGQALYSVFVTRPIGVGGNGERSTPTRRRDTQYLPVSALPERPGRSPGGGFEMCPELNGVSVWTANWHDVPVEGMR